MKAHIGVDMASGLVHTVPGTAANVADVAQTAALFHGEEEAAFADAGYIGVEKREEVIAKHAGVEFHMAAKRSKLKAMAEGALKETVQKLEKLKAQVRAVVEHPFHVVKNLFLYQKVRSRGIAKNLAQLHTLFALANLQIAKRALLGGAMP
jgi:IS5 family transposase